MNQEKDLKTILNNLHYTDDAKVLEQMSGHTKMVMSRMKGIRRKVEIIQNRLGSTLLQDYS